jgi:hypothetical protein
MSVTVNVRVLREFELDDQKAETLFAAEHEAFRLDKGEEYDRKDWLMEVFQELFDDPYAPEGLFKEVGIEDTEFEFEWGSS